MDWSSASGQKYSKHETWNTSTDWTRASFGAQYIEHPLKNDYTEPRIVTWLFSSPVDVCLVSTSPVWSCTFVFKYCPRQLDCILYCQKRGPPPRPAPPRSSGQDKSWTMASCSDCSVLDRGSTCITFLLLLAIGEEKSGWFYTMSLGRHPQKGTNQKVRG